MNGLAEFTKAGTANVYLVDCKSVPRRKGADIFLPRNPYSDFFPLKGGEQFLYTFRDIPVSRVPTIYFGGTDENPFLVRLHGGPLEAYEKGGEDAFFDFLKPREIRRLEQRLHVIAKRQGDIFAMPLPFDWPDVDLITAVVRGYPSIQGPAEDDVSIRHLFDTRHTMDGLASTLDPSRTRILGQGIITAPDHAPLVLDGIHLIVQAVGLYDSRSAD